MHLALTFVMIAAWVQIPSKVQAICPLDCSCPPSLPCPPGVPSLPDGCGCGCQVCAAQLGEECSELSPCDSSQGLRCDLGNDLERQEGFCTAIEGERSCFINGTMYLHQERFQLGCQALCRCKDGSVGCVPLCPLVKPLKPPGCKDMQLVKVPGQCCREWQCVDANRVEDWLVTADKEESQGENDVDASSRVWGGGTGPSWNDELGRSPRRKTQLKSRKSKVELQGDPKERDPETREGRFCQVNGSVYQHGEKFQMGCQGMCVCHDTTIACVSLCPPTSPPRLPGCRLLEQVEVPGKCCKEWVCTEYQGPMKHKLGQAWNRIQPEGFRETAVLKRRKARAQLERKTNLTAPQGDKRSDKGRTTAGEDSDSCGKEPTEWSQCSKTCGQGLSVRLVWKGRSCTLQPERRLCLVQPCGDFLQTGNYTVLKKGPKCTRVLRTNEPWFWSYKDCKSKKPLLPIFCGSCLDGRQCLPSKTRTLSLRFHCNKGVSSTRNVMWIQNCTCERKQRGGTKRLQGQPSDNTLPEPV
ncbi:CCN family member 1 [Microcaecilia unicolor]|uniref:CCN family member 1-like n=1 Tax=Microcaecilia unicolor TaxID=1415580 RepID=A0A6P7XSA7_9AMPH|nr:CCN family member 1-like [Microcaecilia unicolor]